MKQMQQKICQSKIITRRALVIVKNDQWLVVVKLYSSATLQPSLGTILQPYPSITLPPSPSTDWQPSLGTTSLPSPGTTSKQMPVTLSPGTYSQQFYGTILQPPTITISKPTHTWVLVNVANKQYGDTMYPICFNDNFLK